MKKLPALFLLLTLLCALAACTAPTDGETVNSSASENSASADIPDLQALPYDSYDALQTAVQNGFGDDYDRQAIEQHPQLMETLDGFIAALQANGVPIPLLAGKQMPLRDREGFSNISFYMNELYGLPWIWYHPFAESGRNFYITVTVIPETVSDELKNGSASALIRALSPDSPNTHNAQESTRLKQVSEREIALKDRTVMSLTYEYHDDSRVHTQFIYDDLLIRVCGDPAEWDEQWFAKLSFETHPTNQ